MISKYFPNLIKSAQILVKKYARMFQVLKSLGELSEEEFHSLLEKSEKSDKARTPAQENGSFSIVPLHPSSSSSSDSSGSRGKNISPERPHKLYLVKDTP
jgi:hypothetical protein